MNDSLGVGKDNPWNDFLNEISDKFKNNTSFRCNTDILENGNVEGWYPVSSKFWRSQSVLRCKICERIIISRKFVNHFVSKHLTENNCEEIKNDGEKRIKRSRKKRLKIKTENLIEKEQSPIMETKKRRNFPIKIHKTSKRSHSVFRDDKNVDINNCDYINYNKSKNCRKRKKSDKLFCDNSTNCLTLEDNNPNQSFISNDDDGGGGDYLASDNETTDLNQMETLSTNEDMDDSKSLVGMFNTSGDIAPFNDDRLYSNIDSINNRISSDSSTPPSLSLGGASSNLHTLSSPGSCLQTVNSNLDSTAEHYHLPLSTNDDLTLDRSNSCYKYQIDSLPWENIPPPPPVLSHSETPNKSSGSIIESEDCGEIERAVQSITSSFYSNDSTNRINKQSQFIAHKDSQDVTYREIFSNNTNNQVTNTKPPPLYPANSPYNDTGANDSSCHNSLTNDDVSIIDSFLDEIVQQQLNSNNNNTNSNLENNNVAQPNTSSDSISNNKLDDNSTMDYHDDQNNTLFSNNFMSDYDEKFEALINSALSDFVTHSPNNVSNNNNTNQTVTSTTNPTNLNQNNAITLNTSSVNLKRGSCTKNSSKAYDPLKHCGVNDQNGEICFRGLLCKHHTMPQKRLVDRPESISSLIKAKKAKKKLPINNDVNIAESPSITIENKPPIITNVPLITRKKLKDVFKPMVEPLFNEALKIKHNRDAHKPYIAMKSMVWKSVLRSKQSTTVSISNSKTTISDNKFNISNKQASDESQNLITKNSNNNGCVTGFESFNKSNVNHGHVGLVDSSKPDTDNHETFTGTNVKNELLLQNSNIKDSGTVNILKNNTPKPPALTNNAKIYNPYSTNSSSDTSTNPVAPLSSTDLLLPKQLITQQHPTLPATAIYYQQLPGNNTGNNMNESNMAPAQQLFYPIRTTGTLSGAPGAGRILMVMNSLPQATPTISIPNPQHTPTSTIDTSHLLDNNNVTNTNPSISIGGFSNTNNNTTSLSTNTSNGMPLTVHSSTPNGVTQRFVILPDGTISGAAAANQNNYANQQVLTGSNLRSSQNAPTVTKYTTHTPNNNPQPQDNKIIITAPHTNNSAANHQFIMPPTHNTQHLVSPHHFQTITHPDNATANFSLYQQPQPQQKITFQLPFMSTHPNTGQFVLASHPSHPHTPGNQISFKPPPHSTNSNSSFLVNSSSSDTFNVTSTLTPNSACITTTSNITGNVHEQQPYSAESSIITVDSQSSTPVKGNAYSLCPDVTLKQHQQPQSISINTGHSNNSLITGCFTPLNTGHNASLLHNHPSPSPSGLSDTTSDTNLILSSQQKHSTATAIMFHTPQLSRHQSNTSNSSDQQQIYTNNSNLSNYFKTSASIAPPTLVISPRFIQQHNANQLIASTPANFSPHNFSPNNHATTVYRTTVNNAIGHGNLLQQTNHHCPIAQTQESQSNSSLQSNTDIQLDESSQMKSNDFVVMQPVMGQ